MYEKLKDNAEEKLKETAYGEQEIRNEYLTVFEKNDLLFFQITMLFSRPLSLLRSSGKKGVLYHLKKGKIKKVL